MVGTTSEMHMRLARLEALVTSQNQAMMDRLDAQNDLLGVKLDAQNALLEEKLSHQEAVISARISMICTSVEDHETRLRTQEKRSKIHEWVEGMTAFAVAASFFWPTNW